MGYVAADFRVKHRDYFNLNKMYKACHEWFVEQEWGERDDQHFPETKMHHRYLSNNTQEVRVWWRFSKAPGMESTYLRYFIDVNFIALYIKEVDYLYRGKKFKANLGEVEVTVLARLVTDYQGKWANHWLLKNFEEIFWKRILRGEIQSHRAELQKEAYRFQDWLKQFFNYPVAQIEPAGQGNFVPQLGIDEH